MNYKHCFLSVLFVASCGEIPDATTNYYLTKSELRVDVTRTLLCSGDEDTGFLIVSSSVSPVITNSADLGAPQQFDLQKLKGTFTDPDATVQFYPDARLMSINSTQTGTAKQVIESVLNTASPVLAKKRNELTKPKDVCDLISDYSGQKEGERQKVVIEYSAQVERFYSGFHQEIQPTRESEQYHTAFRGWIGDTHIRIGKSGNQPLRRPVTFGPNGSDQSLVARQLTKVSFGVHINNNKESFWEGAVLLALRGNEYEIPLPNRPAFGTADFEVAFDDSGALTKLRYASTSGANDAVDLIGSVSESLQGPSAADQAAALQAEADLIQQRQRLANCQADPANCK